MKPILLTPMLYGKHCVVRLPNGKQYRRVVRYSKEDGLYIVIATRKFLKSGMTYDYKREYENEFEPEEHV